MGNRLLRGTNVPAEFKSVRFTDYDLDRGDPYILERLEAWQPTSRRPSVLMQGAPGLGKTMLAAATLNEYQDGFSKPQGVKDSTLVALQQERHPAYFIQMAEWLNLQLRSFRLHDQVCAGLIDSEEYLEIERLLDDLLCSVQLLVVDDVGKEHRTSSGFAEDAFDHLVRTRHHHGLHTIYTTNLALPSWSQQYSESMQDMIRRSSLVLKFR